MTRLRVELDDLVALADRMAAVEAQLARVHEDVTARTSHLDWTGRAAAEHADTQRQWAAGAELLHAGLAELRAAVRVAHGNYEAAVRANRQMWAR